MLLQERIQELNSGIINIVNDKIHLTGFMSSERLLDYYNEGYDCRFSIGIYPKENFDIAYIKDNGLFIILKDGQEVNRYEFKQIVNETVKYKDDNNKLRSKVYTIRYCKYSNKYNYKDSDKSILFDNKKELLAYFFKEYGTNLQLS